MLDKGSRLGPFEILQPLGSGGMGNVYQARDTRLGRSVVIKTLRDELVRRPESVARFRNEARAASALNHPSIVHIYDIDEIVPLRPDGTPSPEGPVLYIVMEYVRGETLRERFRRAASSQTEIVAIHAQLADALARAHEAGIVHCDLKPENVMISDDGFVRILDFGLAKLTEPDFDPSSGDAETAPLPHSGGMLLGTASYMAPEQLTGQPASSRSDLFAIGCMLYEGLIKKHPFQRPSTVETIHAIVYERPLPPGESGIILPRPLEQLLTRCLEKDPEDRYGSARQLAEDLRESARSLSGELPARPGTGHRGVSPRRWIGVTVMVFLLVAAALVYALWRPHDQKNREAPGQRIESIAVLPFDATGDPDTEYLGEGMSESIMYGLSRTKTLRVLPRSSVFAAGLGGSDPRTVGRRLGVDAVVAGEVDQTPSKLIVRAELIDVESGALIWGRRFERTMADLVDVQNAIERDIRVALRGDQGPVAKTTADPEAFRLYLRGRYYWNKRTAPGLQHATEQFQHAIERDPSFALAWVGLGDSFALREQYAGIPSRENCPKAKAAISRARELDPSLAQSYASSGLLDGHCDWNWTLAEASFERAIELNPNYATSYHWFALHLAYRGQYERGAAMARKAQELDPLSLIANNALSVVEGYAAHWQVVLDQSERLIEMDPGFPVAHMWKGRALRALGRPDEALVDLRRAWDLSGERSCEVAGEIGSTLALAGRREEALEWVRLLEDRIPGNPGASYSIAAIHATLGDSDEAIAWLEKSFEARSWFLVQIAVDPLFESLHRDPRFRGMTARVHLESALR